MARNTNTSANVQPAAVLALALAWILPGAGHIYLGRHLRGLIILLTLGATFWAGVAVGGVMTVDPRTERWWFAAQMGAGVHGLVGWQRGNRTYEDVLTELRRGESDLARRYRQDMKKFRGSGAGDAAAQVQRDYIDAVLAARQYPPQAAAEHRTALIEPMATVARSYTGIAGLLNLLCMFDALLLGLLGVRGEPAAGGGAPTGPPESAGAGREGANA